MPKPSLLILPVALLLCAGCAIDRSRFIRIDGNILDEENLAPDVRTVRAHWPGFGREGPSVRDYDVTETGEFALTSGLIFDEMWLILPVIEPLVPFRSPLSPEGMRWEFLGPEGGGRGYVSIVERGGRLLIVDGRGGAVVGSCEPVRLSYESAEYRCSLRRR